MSIIQQISDSELEIMRVVWQNGSALFAQIMAALSEKEMNWKPNTVLTFLARLNEKGFLKIVKHGRLNEYVALISEQQYLAGQTQTFIHKVYGGNAKGLVASLLKLDYISSNDIDELKQFWEGADINE